MKLHDLKPAAGAHKVGKRVGRGHGSGKGKTAGRGMMGQKARSGPGPHRAFEGGQNEITRRLPFKRGVGFQNRYRIEYEIFNIGDLAATQHDEITPELLVQARLLKNLKKPVKILGDGEINRPMRITAHRFSASARAKIEAAGGTVIELGAPQVKRLPRRGRF
ncbi:50S ribosomal protein L15 [Kallotenue papyrolyticum]|uniref:50S ribosomal protein L15 n=1 Tax=Kallotenue papyrolyticum TaxID=1325125 RepID=UPI0004785D99|nr:50S ribosomal protein L15 [Kallotenue papyrolyticum]